LAARTLLGIGEIATHLTSFGVCVHWLLDDRSGGYAIIAVAERIKRTRIRRELQQVVARVPVIIPFYKARAKLEKCVDHLRRQTYRNVEIFVRDNSDDNIYFTAAVNEGLLKFIADPAVKHIVVLNQDAYLDPRAIAVLTDFLTRHDDVGIGCPIQLDEAGEVTWGGSLQSFPVGVHRCDPIESHQAPFETPWGNGAALMIKADVVREVGLFDRNMRFICSDADFSLSARARGWKVFAVPEARCTHSLGGSAGGSLELEVIKLRDAIYFAQKWLSGGLYRSLAYEGSKLMRTEVSIEIQRMQKALDAHERLLAGRTAPLKTVVSP
jgi:GT2 family glycosyltransferase